MIEVAGDVGIGEDTPGLRADFSFGVAATDMRQDEMLHSFVAGQRRRPCRRHMAEIGGHVRFGFHVGRFHHQRVGTAYYLAQVIGAARVADVDVFRARLFRAENIVGTYHAAIGQRHWLAPHQNRSLRPEGHPQFVGPLGEERPVGLFLKQIAQIIRPAMADLERRQAEFVVGGDDVARSDGVEADVDGRPVSGEDDLEQQVVDAGQRRPPAVDVDVVQIFPAGAVGALAVALAGAT